MAPLVFLLLGTVIPLLAGRFGVRWLRGWPIAARCGLAVMFTVTGITHFVGMRAEMIAMVPPALPAPELLVDITGVLELAGAVGVLLPLTAPLATAGLGVMLLGMFPANVYKALTGTGLAFEDQLVPRTVLQLLYLVPVAALIRHYLRTGWPRRAQLQHS
ncbi:DoxX family protein [Sciscionella sediminilitoris]|uniref:DoxX family protein n=1 Tax=Sciscionella sediminilitoris TaxID=1445613 RepID=UPI0004DF28EA|nr:DoxX family protein [Sciscionella sp. SE31]